MFGECLLPGFPVRVKRPGWRRGIRRTPGRLIVERASAVIANIRPVWSSIS